MSNQERTRELLDEAGNDSAEQRIQVPEYDSEQYLPGDEAVAAARRDRLRSEFGRVRTYFKSHPNRHWKLQRRLNQARIGETYDIYLTRVVSYAILAGLVGAVIGLAVTGLLSAFGVFSQLTAPPGLTAGLGSVADFIAANRLLFAGATLSMVCMAVCSATTWFGAYYYPHLVVDSRRRNIDIMLPHAIVYMYALSFGGMDFVEVLKRTSKAEGTYGEVSKEVEGIVRDVEVFGNDLFTALRNARNLSPSSNFEEFLDDMLSVLDSGGDMTEFLENQSEKYMEEAKDEQDRFLETLATMSEVFVVAFVAAPLFLIVTFMMMSFLGARTLPILFVLIYAILPLGVAAFLVLISIISEPYKQPGHDPVEESRYAERAAPELADHPGYQIYRSIRLKAKLRSFLDDPAAVFKNEPPVVLAVSVPAALLVTGVLVSWTGTAVSPAAFVEHPVSTTFILVVTPFLVTTVPLSVFHELRRRRKRQVAKRFPDALTLLASANQMGVQLTEGLDLVARNLSGTFAEELRLVRNDITWNHDIQDALLSLASRLRVPQLTRTCKILAEGSRSTSDLYRVLSIAAEDTRHRYRLAQRRSQQLSSYTAIVVIGFLVFLGVIVVIKVSFLGSIVQGIDTSSQTETPIQIGGNVDLYRLAFFHSALVQGVGTGLITGKLTDNSVVSGLKYSIALVLLAVGVFLVL